MISAYYYLQIIKLMYFKDSVHFTYKIFTDLTSPIKTELSFNASILLGLSLYIILTALIYPTPLLYIANDTILNTLIYVAIYITKA